MIYTLIYRCFQICCNWSMFRQQLILLREIFQKNGYPENFIDRCFKVLLNSIHILKEKVPTIEKDTSANKSFLIQELYNCKLGLNCSKLQVILKLQNTLCNNFRFKDLVPQIVLQVWFVTFIEVNPITENVLDILL